MKAIFETSADSKTLASVLAECAVGGVVTYDQLTAAIGRDVRLEAMSALISARKQVQAEKRMVFGAVSKVGLMRLSDEQIVDLSDKTRDHLRRMTRQTVKKLHCVDYDAMPKDKQTKHNTALSMLGVIGELSTEKSMTRLSKAVRTQQTLPIAKAAIAALGGII